ncbi:MAG: hypothetical protein IJ650_01720 [Paludibacteraceae bacterium]|nr:hypothetical protein [Paludibacteraceae bacterium]
MKRIFSLLIVAMIVFSVYADNSPLATNTSSGRYEIIQYDYQDIKGIDYKYTFKLDKYEGKVYEFIDVYKQDHWRLMNRFDGPSSDENPIPDTINYQIYMGENVFKIFLLNIHTGKTWLLHATPEVNYWEICK